MKHHDADALSLSLGLDHGHEGQLHTDPDHPVEAPHSTHDWVLRARFAECSICAARDHWREASSPCTGVPDPEIGVPLEAARVILTDEIASFFAWWKARAEDGLGLPAILPTLNDWRAEAFEYSRDVKANQRKRVRRT